MNYSQCTEFESKKLAFLYTVDFMIICMWIFVDFDHREREGKILEMLNECSFGLFPFSFWIKECLPGFDGSAGFGPLPFSCSHVTNPKVRSAKISRSCDLNFKDLHQVACPAYNSAPECHDHGEGMVIRTVKKSFRSLRFRGVGKRG